ncbi:hypothetical protein [Sessilibacter sp. MAH2]
MKITKYILGLIFITSFSNLSLADVVTIVEFENIKNRDQQLINGTNVSGSIYPAIPSVLISNDPPSIHESRTPGDLVDSGIITFQSCRFNWSTIRMGGIYTFSRGAEPSSSCSLLVITQNPFTGEHRLRFQIN